MPNNNLITYAEFTPFVRSLIKLADKVDVKISPMISKSYVPNLKISITPKSFLGLNFDVVGPYYFDLSSSQIKTKSLSFGHIWSTRISNSTKVIRPKHTFDKYISSTLKKSLAILCRHVYVSTLTGMASSDKYSVTIANIDFVKSKLSPINKQLDLKTSKVLKQYLSQIREIDNKIMQLNLKMHGERAGKFIKHLWSYGKENINVKKDKTRHEHKMLLQKIVKLQNQRKILDGKLSILKYEAEEFKEKIENRARTKAHKSIRKILYNPKRKDLLITCSILFLPASSSRKRLLDFN